MSSLQAAFLSALAGTNVAEAAARAAVTALSNVDYDEADKNAGGDLSRQGIKDQSLTFAVCFCLSQPTPIVSDNFVF